MEILDIVLYSLIGVAVLTLIVCLAIANYAGQNLIVVYNKYSNYSVDYQNSLTFADTVSLNEFRGKIKSTVIPGFLTDYYYKGTINLSQNVAYSTHVPALAVCAHELGHAMQYRDTPKKMNTFTSRLMLCRILSKLTLPFIVAGIVCIFFDLMIAIILLSIGVISFILGLFAKLSTIKIEKEASENAIILLQRYAYFDDEAIKIAKKVLSAAKLTYIASFLKSVLAWTFLVKKYDFY